MEIKLSVLIATTSVRNEIIKPLLIELTRQMKGKVNQVELIINNHETDCIGKKRNHLLYRAVGEYVVFIDSDDEIAPDYIEKILTAIESKPDCIGISGIITTDGRDQRQWHISKEYGSWFTGEDGIYYRTPNHISPVRRGLALQAGFPEIAFGEDAEYSRRLLPLLKTEVVVPGNLYFYKYISNKK